jgi:hypothetical protein
MIRPSPHPWSDHPNDIQQEAQIMKLINTQSPRSSCYFLPSGFKLSAQHPVLENTKGLLFFLNLKDQVPYTNKIPGKTTVLYLFIFLLFIADEKTEDSEPDNIH